MNIALIGYGKMGKEIEQIALQRGHKVVFVVDLHNAKSFTNEELRAADVAIEFTNPHSVISNIERCFDAGVPVVVGSTGWYDKADEIRKQCMQKGQALFYASNFSVGVNIFFKLNEYLAKVMNNYAEYDVSMEEIHHVHKLDSPSGTGLSLANQILSNIQRKKRWIEGQPSDLSDLVIDAKRVGEVPGTHIVRYHCPIDEIEIKHTAHNRKGFALGAVLSAEFLKGKKGVFGMDDLLKFS